MAGSREEHRCRCVRVRGRRSKTTTEGVFTHIILALDIKQDACGLVTKNNNINKKCSCVYQDGKDLEFSNWTVSQDLWQPCSCRSVLIRPCCIEPESGMCFSKEAENNGCRHKRVKLFGSEDYAAQLCTRWLTFYQDLLQSALLITVSVRRPFLI